MNNPEQALTAWIKLINAARHKAMENQWKVAVKLYGNAFEVSQLIFLHTPRTIEANRYVRTAIEFVFSLRYSGYPANLDLLIAAIQDCLETILSPEESRKNIEPLQDVAFSPMSEVDRWMQMFYGVESSYGKTIH